MPKPLCFDLRCLCGNSRQSETTHGGPQMTGAIQFHSHMQRDDDDDYYCYVYYTLFANSDGLESAIPRMMI